MTPSEELTAAAAVLRRPHPNAAITATPTMAALLRARQPLAAWLEAAAAEVARVEERYRDRTAGESMAPNALAVARAINGSNT